MCECSAFRCQMNYLGTEVAGNCELSNVGSGKNMGSVQAQYVYYNAGLPYRPYWLILHLKRENKINKAIQQQQSPLNVQKGICNLH